MEIIRNLRRTLDEIEATIKPDQKRLNTVDIGLKKRTSQSWRPFKEGDPAKIWNCKKFCWETLENITDGGVIDILKTIGAVEFFQKGKFTLEWVQAISPQLILLVGDTEGVLRMLKKHESKLKNRGKEATKIAVPEIRDELAKLQPGEPSRKIYSRPMAYLFWKHLGGAIDINYMILDREDPASIWADAAFLGLVKLVRQGRADFMVVPYVGGENTCRRTVAARFGPNSCGTILWWPSTAVEERRDRDLAKQRVTQPTGWSR